MVLSGQIEKVGAGAGQLLRRRHHQFRHARPIARFDALHVFSQRVGVHRDFGMIVAPQQFRAFQADGAVAERRALRAASDDADVLGHIRNAAV